MITFACKNIDKEEIIRCSLNLNKTEYKILDFLFSNDREITTIGISKKMGLERTTIQKGIKNLMRKSLVNRHKTNLKDGGYVFVYRLNDKIKIKEKIKTTITNWYGNALKRVDML